MRRFACLQYQFLWSARYPCFKLSPAVSASMGSTLRFAQSHPLKEVISIQLDARRLERKSHSVPNQDKPNPRERGIFSSLYPHCHFQKPTFDIRTNTYRRLLYFHPYEKDHSGRKCWPDKRLQRTHTPLSDVK